MRALAWSLVEGRQLGRPRDMQGRTELCGLSGTWRNTCGLQQCAIFSVLSPPPKGQVWDHIGLMESAQALHLGDTLGPHTTHSWCYTPRTLFSTGLLTPPHRLGKPFCCDEWPPAAHLLVGSNPRPVPQSLLGSSREPVSLRQQVAGCGVLRAFLRGNHGPSPLQKPRLH